MQLKYQNLSYDQTDVNETWYVYLLTKYLYICKLRYWGPLGHIELSHSLIYTLLLLLFFFTPFDTLSGKHKIREVFESSNYLLRKFRVNI